MMCRRLFEVSYFAFPRRPRFSGPSNTSPDEEGNESTRSLGLVVARGTLLVLISPEDGSEVIANPFVTEEAE